MYDDSDLDAAVAAGTLGQADVQRLRRFVAQRRTDPPAPADDRNFRFTASAGDILPTIGILALLIGTSMIAWPLLGPWGGGAMAALSWLLAERFASRRLGPPTTLLFLAYALGCAVCLAGLAFGSPETATFNPVGGLIVAPGCALAAYLFWRRFRLPIAVPAALLSLFTIGDHLLMMAVPDASAGLITAWTLVAAFGMFAAAMWWDASDVYRQTLRSDVAYWLHALAAFQLLAALFRGLFGKPDGPGWNKLWVTASTVGAGPTLIALGICIAALLVSLIIDRRALVVVALLFLWRMAFHSTDGPASALALLMSGAVVVTLTLRWTTLRRALLGRLPMAFRAQLPRSDPQFWFDRPVT